METIHVAGLAILAFIALPAFDAAHAAVFSNGLAFVPSIILTFSRFGLKKEKNRWIKTFFDIVAILAQISAIFVAPILFWKNQSTLTRTDWALPIGLLMTSFGWWECFVVEERDVESKLWIVRKLQDIRLGMIEGSRYFTYLFISAWKICVFFAFTWGLTFYMGLYRDKFTLFKVFKQSFKSHQYNVTEISDIVLGGSNASMRAEEKQFVGILETEDLTPLWVLLIHIGATHMTYILSKFACKVQIQGFSYAFPITLVVPVTVTLLLTGCGFRAKNICSYDRFIPGYLFFECPSIGDFWTYIWEEQTWLWGVWFLSQIWITRHIWFPESPRLASTEHIFGTPMYCSLFIDQSVVMNRRRDGPMGNMTIEELEDEQRKEEQTRLFIQANNAQVKSPSGNGDSSENSMNRCHSSDRITRIYGCATMWHENKEEMVEMLKSIFRIDKDYHERRISQDIFQVFDADFYEWETHIFFDDAFALHDPKSDSEHQVVNKYVKDLVQLMDQAGTFVHCQDVRIKAPKKIPTPYGGRLIWTLPGKTKIVCHLKDKSKIRHKKRWSQCMYMYYLLGYKLMDLPISNERKQVKAENTYLLALDGDIDFQAESITRLVDLMKKNKGLGAACGRIHPTGSGFMVWYQKFEYAIGHWLQKATEHVLGCVLCSPGCFSLFRGSALMDVNVMAKYTTKSQKPLDYVQYDQGEDRWLCTLLLQRGYRVEYSAASDAFTACPEGFDEFFNQRRRWMPSTIANIFDLLSDAKNVVKVNKDITSFYIMYQVMMMVGTLLGPGTIFLMLVGAFSVAFGISNWDSFVYNLIPIIGFMLVCFIFDSKVQLFIAQILSAVYGLIMMAVLVGILLQMTEDGPLAPSSLSIFIVGGSFILAAVLHPQEFWCLPCGIIYYITIPAMYLLLVIYSIFNLNNVSWGTREAPATVTKKDLDEKKQKEQDALKEAKSKKKQDGILGFFMQQADKRAEKGGLEFSLANLFKIMCFTHEDPAGDANKKLDSIAIELDAIGKKLSRMENMASGERTGSMFTRRKSSGFGHRSRVMDRSNSSDSLRLQTEPDPANLNYADGLDTSADEEEDEDKSPKNTREDLVNPFWIDDRDLKNGQIEFLPGAELKFWKEVIEKYLEPEPLKTKPGVLEEQKKTEASLKELRNKMVFTFFMLNAIFVTAIFLLQQKKDLIFIRWPLDAKANVSYIPSVTSTPTVEVEYEYLQLEPIGLVFVIFFAVVLGFQVIGMLFHRWGTISHIISTTRLPWCDRTSKDESPDGRLNKDVREIVRAIEAEDAAKKRKSKQEQPRPSEGGGRLHRAATTRTDGRRKTILENAAARQKKAQFTNLEDQFKKKLMSLRIEDMENSENPALRRIAARRGTIKAFEQRRQTFFEGEERRRSTIRRMSSLNQTPDGFVNAGFENDSALASDDVDSSIVSRNSRKSQFEYVDIRL